MNEPGPSSAAGKRGIVAWSLIATALVVLAFLGTAAGESDPNVLYDYAFAGGSIVIYGILVGITFAIAARIGRPLEVAGLKRFEWRWVWIAIGLIVLVLVLGQLLEPLLHAGDKQGLEPDEWRPDRAWAFVVNATVASTLVPFAEELFFRGVGVRVWLPFGATAAIVITAMAFGLAHGILVALPVLVPFALALGWVRWRSDSVWPGIIAHGFYNGSALLVLYITLAN